MLRNNKFKSILTNTDSPKKFYRTAIVYFLLYGCNLFVCEIIEVYLLWYVLPNELVCIFISKVILKFY
ncbi:hypothetical protein PIOMA14_I_1792 [Prevotella intermedia]|uniref:Uncharacterized protein n=1 Tax=Prevotella intermedia TaxID=28131 RepID=A0A0S3ULB1_PREIN|nr:hypothetical protein PIOMA14_I_1792 [Prevotella intermedia]